MRAVTLAQVPGTPEVTEAEAPRPQAGEVLVKVAATSVNGFDLERAPEAFAAFGGGTLGKIAITVA
ncbi:hypothetical protein [Streptomyces litchfieldiae]|uniref:Alcohol dehydrogenase n=1 Tax=Streptomyces litchfieldiae TaxID=3075543 RepID=A0ABU2N1S3_9ACTN|nr:hypothetical protein [Streptomyces sp. DSM 44938]MDT0347701.1 hypothetical protein [Streptomyces sp. DSM 44938]